MEGPKMNKKVLLLKGGVIGYFAGGCSSIEEVIDQKIIID